MHFPRKESVEIVIERPVRTEGVGNLFHQQRVALLGIDVEIPLREEVHAELNEVLELLVHHIERVKREEPHEDRGNPETPALRHHVGHGKVIKTDGVIPTRPVGGKEYQQRPETTHGRHAHTDPNEAQEHVRVEPAEPPQVAPWHGDHHRHPRERTGGYPPVGTAALHVVAASVVDARNLQSECLVRHHQDDEDAQIQFGRGEDRRDVQVGGGFHFRLGGALRDVFEGFGLGHSV
mmetsp:Transcript_26191/g.60218  ORF Transcript_26191/g.60218 Transcript_26191/m.60218 type:complete len:235 (-) Transcript_26191:551-1255(-)